MKKYQYNVKVRLQQSITSKMRDAKLLSVTAITSLVMLGASFVPFAVHAQGGSVSTAPATTAAACSTTINSFSDSTGYYGTWSAIWTKFSINNTCAAPADWVMSYTNNNTGEVEFTRGTSTMYMTSGVIDYDWAGFSTPYTVKLVVTDSTGNVLSVRSEVVTTKKAKDVTVI